MRKRALRATGIGLTLVLIGGCGTAEEGGTETETPSSDASSSLGAPPALVAATIGAVMREAGPLYDLVPSQEKPGAYEGEILTRGHTVRHSAEGVAVGSWNETEDFVLRVGEAGCEGRTAAATSVAPTVELNRAGYTHELTGGGSFGSWYLGGPLGLEQGFTLEQDWSCRGRTEIAVQVTGAEVTREGREGGLLLTSTSTGARWHYGHLFAYDASGRALDATIEVKPGNRISLLVDTTGAAFPVTIDPLISGEQAKLLTSDAASDDLFGYAIAMDGDTAVIGAWGDDTAAGTDTGSAYVFFRSGGTWTEQAKLTASDGAPGDQFGVSVAVSGDTALVGASADAGSAYVFTRAGSTWSEQAILSASDAAPSDQFGFALALDGDTAVVGAYGDDHSGATDAGSAYVFVRSGGNWSQQGKLVASDAATEDYFGLTLAISSDTVVVGAYADDHASGVDAGSGYVFVRSAGVWSEQAKLVASDAAANDSFGVAVALSGDTALLGAYADDHAGGTAAGSAYVFTRSGTAWSQQAKLVAGDAAANDYFGFAVAVEGDRAVVGAYADDDLGANAGSAYLFARSGTTWSQTDKTTASDGSVADWFAYSVAISGGTILVGAYGEDNVGGIDAGSVYVKSLKHDPGVSCTSNAECASDFCVDGVCCATACGGGSTTDCQACSTAAGAAANGVCGPIAAATVCRAAAGSCDAAETCDGTNTACPADAMASPGTACSDGNACTVSDGCDGLGSCVSGGTLDCNDADPCTAESCDSVSGCTSTPVTDGTPCGTGVCSAGVCTGYSLSNGPSSVGIGLPVSFDFTAPAGHSAVDWVALYPVGGADYQYLAWKYVGVGTSGTVSMTMPASATVGQTYEVRYMLNNGYTLATTSAPFVVAEPYEVGTSDSYVEPGSTVTADWAAPSSHSSFDWIGVYRPYTPNNQILGYAYVGAAGSTSGSVSVPFPNNAQPGEAFELRYFTNNSYQKEATSLTFVAGNTMTVPSGSVAPDTNFSTTWGAPASHSATDWIGLYPVGAPNYAFEAWVYVGSAGSSTGTSTLHMPASATDGQSYELRYFLNGAYTIAGRSAAFVAGQPYTIDGPIGSVSAGASVNANWSAPSSHSTTDWIGLYAVGAPATALISYAYVGSSGVSSGTVVVGVPANTTPGTYELRYHQNNTYVVRATTSSFSVTP